MKGNILALRLRFIACLPATWPFKDRICASTWRIIAICSKASGDHQLLNDCLNGEAVGPAP